MRAFPAGWSGGRCVLLAWVFPLRGRSSRTDRSLALPDVGPLVLMVAGQGPAKRWCHHVLTTCNLSVSCSRSMPLDTWSPGLGSEAHSGVGPSRPQGGPVWGPRACPGGLGPAASTLHGQRAPRAWWAHLWSRQRSHEGGALWNPMPVPRMTAPRLERPARASVSAPQQTCPRASAAARPAVQVRRLPGDGRPTSGRGQLQSRTRCRRETCKLSYGLRPLPAAGGGLSGPRWAGGTRALQPPGDGACVHRDPIGSPPVGPEEHAAVPGEGNRVAPTRVIPRNPRTELGRNVLGTTSPTFPSECEGDGPSAHYAQRVAVAVGRCPGHRGSRRPSRSWLLRTEAGTPGARERPEADVGQRSSPPAPGGGRGSLPLPLRRPGAC